jgi:DNA primase
VSAYWQAEARFDWAQYVDAQDGKQAMRGRKEEYLLQCPDCDKPKLAVNTRKRKWRCFTCGDGGHDAASLIAKVEQLLWHDALANVLTGSQQVIGRIDQITAAVKDEPEAQRPRNWVPSERPYPDGFVPLDYAVDPFGAVVAARRYCQRRGITHLVALGMRLGVCAGLGRFANRLIFPVLDIAHRLLFYQGRAMWEPGPDEEHIKTLGVWTPPDSKAEAGAGDVLLNLQHVQEQGITRVAIVEGPVDCAHAWPDAVATFGKHITPRQIELLMRAGVRELDLCYDRDRPKRSPTGQLLPGGWEAMQKMAPKLADIFTVRLVQLPMGKDPGDLTKEQIDYYRAQALVWGSGDRLRHLSGTLI